MARRRKLSLSRSRLSATPSDPVQFERPRSPQSPSIARNRPERPLGGHSTGGRLDGGMTHGGRVAIQKQFGMRERTSRGRVRDVTFFRAELRVRASRVTARLARVQRDCSARSRDDTSSQDAYAQFRREHQRGQSIRMRSVPVFDSTPLP
jgi:hypothetical protein